MQRKNYNIKLASFFCLYLLSLSSFSQTEINIPTINIRNRIDYDHNFSAGSYNPSLGLGLLPTIRIRSNSPNYLNTNGSSIPLILSYFKLVSIGSISLLSYSNDLQLTNSYENVYGGVATVGVGDVILNGRLLISNHTWLAGAYKSEIEFSVLGLLVAQISPKTRTLTINVPTFITPEKEIVNTALKVNNLNFYRNPDGIHKEAIIRICTTVPYIPSIIAGNSYFNFNITSPYNNIPTSSTNSVVVSLLNTSTSTSINLLNTKQDLTTVSGIEVPIQNNHSIDYNFAINGASLNSNFVQAGRYSIPITYSYNNGTTNPPSLLGQPITEILEVTVDDMGELISNQQTVNLTFSTANDYQSGVSKDMPSHLKLSKTTPYNLYVHASSSQFTSGATSISLDIMRIGPMTGESGMNTVTLSTTPQLLINNANPVIDRNINIKYTIPASETQKLLNKPLGTYATDIIFTCVAP